MNEIEILANCDNLPENTKNRLRRALNLTVAARKKGKHKCGHKNCKEPSCNSHEISEKSILAGIASQQEVFMLRANFEKNPLRLKLKKIKTKEATTFPGFCRNHDRDLFLDIDNKFLINKNCIYKQCYKSIRRKLYEQEVAFHTFSSVIDELKKEDPVVYRSDNGVRIIRSRRVELRKKIKSLGCAAEVMFGNLDDPGNITYKEYVFPGSCFALSAAADFSKPSDESPENYIFFIHIIPSKTASHVVISHINTAEAESNIIECIKVVGGVFEFVNELVFENRERIVFSISYIRNLDPSELEKLSLLMGVHDNSPTIIPLEWCFVCN